MNGRRAIVGLSVLCALLFSAVAAQAAQAETGQTAVTCAPVIGGAGFTDAHCDHEVPVSATFDHVPITERTAITLTNAATKNETKEAEPALLHVAHLHGIENVNVTCTTVAGTGELENAVNAGGTMEAKGEGEITFSGCSTNVPNCTVTQPIVASVKDHTTQVLGVEMGLKVEPLATNFTTITFTGASCGLRLFPNIPVKGNVTATANGEPLGHGATTRFAEGAMEALTVGGEPAGLTGTATTKGPNGNAIVFTTD